ncbi:MAG: chromosome segregation protein SMC, partial [Proteobacteria bacterium]|nr:chromosome segregation protein SMC [Pseudomonadota bacterium]
LMEVEQQRREASSRAPDAGKHEAAQLRVEQLTLEVEEAEAQLLSIEEQLEALSVAAKATREAASEARLEASRLQAEVQTLTKLLGPVRDDGLPPILDQIKVKSGFEMALGAALGDDLDAPADAAAAIHWLMVEAGADDPKLPAGVEALARHIKGPAELERRLAQVGLVARDDGSKLQQTLKVGQRLVSREGDLWRWDGFVAASDAPSAAAVRLAERNRLAVLAEREDAVVAETERTAIEAERAAARLQAGEGEVRRLRQVGREHQAALARERESLGQMERQAREAQARLAALDESKVRIEEAIAEAAEQLAEAELVLETLEEDGGLDEAVNVALFAADAARRAHAERRDAVQALARDRSQRAERVAATRREQERWKARSADAGRQIEALKARHAELAEELETLAELPATLDERRQLLIDGLAQAERERQHAADRLAAAETSIKRIQQDLREAQGKVAGAREFRARAEAHLEAARVRLGDEGRRTREALDCSPEECLGLAGLEPGSVLPDRAETERQLQKIKTERERLGGVNLNADEELSRISEEHGKLDAERADVEAAVAKLRGAIGQLNREARSRLAEAFNTVNGHFQRLFVTLFGGGEARLEMIESEEDPLEGGLEIIAKPPGKKPATLSLLSGGEQTLTALSLIFAVFLTNPSPICVLDEVDAPLDDSNVDRYCTLMEKMASETATRFLVITHHPMTMARMSRLFGVTMAEKGVSQLVSVDLATAERIVEDDPAEEQKGAA